MWSTWQIGRQKMRGHSMGEGEGVGEGLRAWWWWWYNPGKAEEGHYSKTGSSSFVEGFLSWEQ